MPRDLLDILIGARDSLSRSEISDELFIFFLAGMFGINFLQLISAST